MPESVRPARVIIDGRSGSGKTELARALVLAWPGAQLVRLDDVYPGWGGLERASLSVHRDILRTFRWRRWDWERDAPAELTSLDPGRPIVVEGCGALTARSAALASLCVWVSLGSEERLRRARRRDPEYVADHWQEWAAQEDAFIAARSPQRWADVVVDGAYAIAQARRIRRLSGP